MGVFQRPDSPWWWLWLETAPSRQQKEKTTIKIGTTAAQRKDSRRLAEDLYHQRMRQLAAKIHRLPITPETITFAKYADWYHTHVSAHHRGATREAEILKTLVTAFGRYDLAAIDSAMVLEWRTSRVVIRSPNTVNREVDLLKAIFSSAVPKYLEQSPLTDIRRLRGPRSETRVLTLAEERRLLIALAPADRAIVICALDTLMRLSDVVNLRRDQDRGTYLVVSDPKVDPYKVPVSTRLRQALDALPNAGPYYFSHRRIAKKARDYRSSIKSMLRCACQKAKPKIPYGRKQGGLTFHGLRHTATTRLVEQGISLRIIQELGGWKSLRQLERYAHPTEKTKRAAVELISKKQRRSA
jgi:integrase